MDLIRASAQPLPPWQRSAFLSAVVLALSGQPVGPGSVHRACVEMQREFMRPPVLTREGKYR
jgi:hypothetical protein